MSDLPYSSDDLPEQVPDGWEVPILPRMTTPGEDLLDVCASWVDGYVTSACVVFEFVTEDGDQGILGMWDSSTTPWKAAGMYRHGMHAADKQGFREDG